MRAVLRASGTALLALAVATGCAGAGGEQGTARLWITRDRGARLLLSTAVPAGMTAMQALDREADVDTRYGGRFVQAIDGLEGDLARRRDWFYFVNGIEADRSAAEYRLQAGDVEWWDYRSWRRRMSVPVVVGAFPEPFLHGWAGRTRPAAVRYTRPSQRAGALAIGRLLRARSVRPAGVPVPDEANVFLIVSGRRSLSAQRRRDGGPGTPVRFVFSGDAARLARDPALVRRRYVWP